MGAKLLKDSHDQMVAYHAMKGINLPDSVKNSYPTEAVVAFWDPSVTWSGGAWHNTVRTSSSPGPVVTQCMLRDQSPHAPDPGGWDVHSDIVAHGDRRL